MDFDFRASRVLSAKHFSTVQAARLHSEDERSEKNERRKKLVEKINKDVLALQRSLDFLRTKKVSLLRNVENLPPGSSGSGTLENQKESSTNSGAHFGDDVDVDEDDDEDDFCDESFEDSCIVFDDSDGDDDARACFPCPFCYMEIELSLLCSHLQDEHCFDLKNAVCPLCAANLGKDVIGHFIVQHASSLKRRRKSEKPSFLNGGSAMLGRKLPTNARGNKQESAPDPLLSPFIFSTPFLDPKGIQEDECFRDDSYDISDVKSSDTSSLDEGHEQDKEERRQKADFVQQLIMSTIF